MAGTLDQAAYDRLSAQASKEGKSGLLASTIKQAGYTAPSSVVNTNPAQIYGNAANQMGSGTFSYIGQTYGNQ